MKELLEENGGFFFRFETFAEIGEGLEKVLSPTAQAVIKTSMGKFCGERSYRRIAREIRSKRDVLQFLSQWKSQENWGELSFHEINFERKTGKILVKNHSRPERFQKTMKALNATFSTASSGASSPNSSANP